MFNAIAPRYELVNTVFSAGMDARWRRTAVALAGANPEDDILDIACGTGDFTRAFARARPRSIIGCDFAHDMLKRAGVSSNSSVHWCEADALRLPFPSGVFSITGCAFGVRNFCDLDSGLKEMHRVLRIGGRAVILEFSRPRNMLARGAYGVYSRWIMPAAASWLSGDRTGAYRYLPRSVASFVDVPELMDRLARAGFDRVRAASLTLGIVTVYIAYRDAE